MEVSKKKKVSSVEEYNAFSTIGDLCEDGFIYVESELLEKIDKIYYQSGKNHLEIFSPPKPGTDIILLIHLSDPRHISENNFFGFEEEYSRKYIIYHVEEPMIDERYPYRSKARLTYNIGKSIKRERTIMYQHFYCGLFYCKELSADEKKIIEDYRRLVDEKIPIRHAL